MARRLKRWGIGLAIGAVVAVPIFIMGSHWINGSANGSVRVGKPSAVAAKPQEPLDVKTSYFTTLLPAGFTVRHQTETLAAAPILLQMVANTSGEFDQQFAATVEVTPPGGLRDVSGYNLRVTRTADYAAASLPDLPAGAVAFRATTGPTNFVVFWPHGTHVVELGFSTGGGATEQQLLASYTQVLSTWNWL